MTFLRFSHEMASVMSRVYRIAHEDQAEQIETRHMRAALDEVTGQGGEVPAAGEDGDPRARFSRTETRETGVVSKCDEGARA